MTLRQYVHRAGLPPASQSNFESIAIDAAALPRQRRRNGQKSTRCPQRISPHSENAQAVQEEPSLASMVLFDALALDSSCCLRGRRRHARQGAKLKVPQQASLLVQSSEVVIPLSHVLSSFSPPSEFTKCFDQNGTYCGSSDSTGDHGVSHMHTISDVPSSSNTEADSSHDLNMEADLW